MVLSWTWDFLHAKSMCWDVKPFCRKAVTPLIVFSVSHYTEYSVLPLKKCTNNYASNNLTSKDISNRNVLLLQKGFPAWACITDLWAAILSYEKRINKSMGGRGLFMQSSLLFWGGVGNHIAGNPFTEVFPSGGTTSHVNLCMCMWWNRRRHVYTSIIWRSKYYKAFSKENVKENVSDKYKMSS